MAKIKTDQLPEAEGALTPAQFSERRQYLLDLITENYAHDLLAVDEYELLIQQAQKVRSESGLEDIVQKLPAKILGGQSDHRLGQTEAANSRLPWSAGLTVRANDQPLQPHICLLSGRRLAGDQLTNRQQLSITFMGGTDMDFRKTQLPPGETVVNVFCLMGGLDITVPPGLAVRSTLVPIMGGVDIRANVKSQPEPGEPYLTIAGICLMGGVDIKAK